MIYLKAVEQRESRHETRMLLADRRWQLNVKVNVRTLPQDGEVKKDLYDPEAMAINRTPFVAIDELFSRLWFRCEENPLNENLSHRTVARSLRISQ